MIELFGFKYPAKKTEEQEYVHVESYSSTIGKNPKKNEDSILANKEQRLFGVFDGIGGHIDGEIASALVSNFFAKNLFQLHDGIDIKIAEDILLQKIEEVDAVLYKISKEKHDKERPGKMTAEEKMGTTASVLKIFTDKEGKNWALIANVGDSRIYKINKEGKLIQLTVDDDFLNESELTKEKKLEITTKLSEYNGSTELTRDEKYFFENRHMIGRWLGEGRGSFRVFSVPIEKGDMIFLTTDGIHDNLTSTEIEKIIKLTNSPDRIPTNLTNASFKRSKEKSLRSKPDDMSAVVVLIK